MLGGKVTRIVETKAAAQERLTKEPSFWAYRARKFKFQRPGDEFITWLILNEATRHSVEFGGKLYRLVLGESLEAQLVPELLPRRILSISPDLSGVLQSNSVRSKP